MHEWILALASHPRARQWIIALAIVLVLPGLTAGFFADDFGHFLLIREPGLIPQSTQGSLFHLFAFLDDDPARRQMQYSLSLIPWWTSESLMLNFWRPLSELSHYVDYSLFPQQPWLMHLHSIAWYSLLLWLVWFFYKNIFATAHLAVIALLFFAVDATHGMTVAWLANRNALIAAVFALLALMLYGRFRNTARKADLFCSAMALIAALLAAEIGVSIGGFLLAYALFLDRDGPLTGLRHLWPLLVIAAIWQLIYRYLDYGVSGSATFYLDPLASPLRYLQSLLERFPLALSAQFNLLPIHLVSFLQTPAMVSGVVIFLTLLIVAVRKRDAVFSFLLLSLTLAVLPVSTTVIQERNMLFVGIAGAGILAKLVEWLVEARQRKCRVALTSLCLGLLLFFHVLVSALLIVPMAMAPAVLAKNSIAAAQSIKLDSTKRIVSLGVPLFDAGYVAAIRRVYGLPLPEGLWNITTFTEGLSVKRLPANHLLVAGRQGLLQQEDLLLRNLAEEPLLNGQIVDLHGLQIRIVETNQQGIPVVIELMPDPATAEAGFQLMYWHSGKLIPLVLAENQAHHFAADHGDGRSWSDRIKQYLPDW